MSTPAQPLARRLLWWAIAAMVIALLALAAVWGWRWLQNQAERREALQLIETYRFDAAEQSKSASSTAAAATGCARGRSGRKGSPRRSPLRSTGHKKGLRPPRERAAGASS